MTVAALSVSAKPLLELEADVLVLGVRKTDDGPELVSEEDGLQPIRDALSSIGMTGAHDELQRMPAQVGAARSVALVGVGSGELTADTVRYAAGSAARQLRGIGSIVLGLPADNESLLLAALE